MVEEVVEHLGISKRRACKALGQSRATQRYLPLVHEDEDKLTQRIIELAAVYGRYGTPRIKPKDFDCKLLANKFAKQIVSFA